MSECPVCGKEVKASLRKHATGKWHNNQDDFEHLKLAVQLTPGAPAFLADIYSKEGLDGTRGRHELPIVRGTILHEDRHELPIVRGTIHHED